MNKRYEPPKIYTGSDMAKVVLIGLCLILLFFTLGALAEKASAHQQHTMFANLANQQLAQTSIVNQACPDDFDDEMACVDRASRIIYIEPVAGRKAILYHEAGHLFDYWLLTDAERIQVEMTMEWETWKSESFADHFAACNLTRKERSHAAHLGVA